MSTSPPRAAEIGADHSFSEEWVGEDAALANARARAAEFGLEVVSPAAGSALRFLCATLAARAVVELGSGTGVSALWLLRGMRSDGVLTSIDTEPEHQQMAKASVAEAGVDPARVRFISGRALEVLPRLTDGGYDLVLSDAAPVEHAEHLREAERLLRPGGVVVFTQALRRGRVADPTTRDPETVAVRALLRTVHDQVGSPDALVPLLLPVGSGLLALLKSEV